jgi:hypothetical protein
MLQRAHRLQSDKTWIEESKNQIKALKLELKDKLEKFNKDVDAFELLKKQDSAYEPSEPVQSNAQDVSELKAQVEKLQKLLDLQKLALIDAQKASSSSAVNVTPPAQGARSTLKERPEEKKHKPFKQSLLEKLSVLAKSPTNNSNIAIKISPKLSLFIECLRVVSQTSHVLRLIADNS